jgi:hypothetical protein
MEPLPLRRLASTFAVLLLAAAPGLAGVIRIADQPGLGPYVTLQSAVDAAPPGALLLVGSGNYASATIDGKSLSIVAMPTSGTKNAFSITVKNLTSDEWVLVSGLRIVAMGGITPGVTLTNNAGQVRLNDCIITGSKGNSWSQSAFAGLLVNSCPKVIVTGCTIKGGSMGFLSGEPPVAGGHGVESISSSMALFDCTLTGGKGSEEGYPSGGRGGDGLHVTDWGFFASGCTFNGGAGGGGDYIGCCAGGDGGDGLDLTSAQAVHLDVVTTPGNGGWSICQMYGSQGLPIHNDDGLLLELPGTRRKLTGASLASDESSLTLTLTGQPGDRLFLMRAYAPGWVYMQGIGIWTVRKPTFTPVVPLGTVPASGTLTVLVPAGNIPGPPAHALAYVQGLVIDAFGKPFLTTPLHVELFDRSGGPDCNSNLVNDFVDLLELPNSDCNTNIALDTCDIATGSSPDVNGNGIPDECEL